MAGCGSIGWLFMSGEDQQPASVPLQYQSRGDTPVPASSPLAVRLAWGACISAGLAAAGATCKLALPYRLSDLQWQMLGIAETLGLLAPVAGCIYAVAARRYSPRGSYARNAGTAALLVSFAAFGFTAMTPNIHPGPDARGECARATLRDIRTAVLQYRLQHGGAYPTSDGTITGQWQWNLITTPRPGGSPAAAPWSSMPPINPYSGSTNVGPAPSAGTGWVITPYGEIHATDKTGTGVLPE